METYFDVTAEGGGMFCQEEYDEWDSLFVKMGKTHREAVEAVGGEYIPQNHERNCAIRVARNAFFKVCGAINHSLTCITYHRHVLLIT